MMISIDDKHTHLGYNQIMSLTRLNFWHFKTAMHCSYFKK